MAALLSKDPSLRPSPGQILTEMAGVSADPARAVTELLDRTWILPASEAVRVPAAKTAGPRPPRTSRRRRGLAAALIAAAITAGLVAALLLDGAPSKHRLLATSQPTATSVQATTTTDVTSATTAVTPTPSPAPPPTSATSSDSIQTLPVTSCPTTYGAQGATSPPVPTSLNTLHFSTGVAAYSNGLTSLLAPSGWNCAGSVGADGNESLAIFPAGQGNPTSSNGRASNDLGVNVFVASSSGVASYQACPFFPSAASQSPTACQPRPAGESVSTDGPNIVEFQDPAYLAGDGSPSGGPYPANGVVVWYPASSYEANATCTLPEGQHALCTDVLNDFIDRYSSPSAK